MKATLSLLALLFVAATASAQEKVIKECSVTMKQPEGDKIVNMKMQIISKEDESIYAKISQTVGEESSSYNDVAEISEGKIRENLTADSDLEDLNHAESLVVHAMMLSEDPVFEGEYSAGFDLKMVRSAKLFTVGQNTNMGSSTIIEVRDANNQVLGSFLGGFLVSPCK